MRRRGGESFLGDDPDVCAIVTMNIAAIAAEDARSVLVIDAAGRGEAIRSLLPFSPSADLADLIGGIASWVDATAHVAVGRDRTIDVVTGTRSTVPASLIELVQRERQSLGRHYDSVFVIGSLDLISATSKGTADTKARTLPCSSSLVSRSNCDGTSRRTRSGATA